MDVVSILEKKRQRVLDLEIEVRGTKRTDDYPKIYEHIEVEYVVTGIDVKPEAVARAIELSEEKYCSVKGMLGPQVEVATSYRVIEAELAGD
jgi:putative redox protein